MSNSLLDLKAPSQPRVITTQHGMPFNYILLMLALVVSSVLGGIWMMKSQQPPAMAEQSAPSSTDVVVKLLERQTIAMELIAQDLSSLRQVLEPTLEHANVALEPFQKPEHEPIPAVPIVPPSKSNK